MLMPYHDSELPLSRRSMLEEHLLGCPSCSAILDDLERADTAANVPDPGPEYWSSFTGRVMDRIDDAGLERKPVARLRDLAGFGRALRYAPALSAVLVLVVAAGLLVDVNIRIRMPFGKPALEKSVAEKDDAGRYDKDARASEPAAFAMKEKAGIALDYTGERSRPADSASFSSTSPGRHRLSEPAANEYAFNRRNILDMLDKNLAGGELVLIQVLTYSSSGDVTEMRALKTDLTRSGLADRSLMLRDTVSSAGDPDLTTLLNDLAAALRELETAPAQNLSGVQGRIRSSGLLERTADYRLMLASEEVMGK